MATQHDIQPEELFGVGLYAISQASRLLNMAPTRLTQWFFSYSETRTPTLHEAKFPSSHGRILTFQELMEARSVLRFNEAGVTMRSISKTNTALKKFLKIPYPLTSKKLVTDGRKIFLDDPENNRSLDILMSQENFRNVILQTFKDIDFEDDFPRFWWPVGKKQGIVLDPERCFGKPILDEIRLPTETIYEQTKAHEKRGAKDPLSLFVKEFGLEKFAVQVDCAYQFEQNLRHENQPTERRGANFWFMPRHFAPLF